MINVSAFQQKKPVASKINLNFVKLFFANNSVLNGNGAAVSLNLVVELKKKGTGIISSSMVARSSGIRHCPAARFGCQNG